MNRKMNYLTLIVAGIRNKPGRNLGTVFCLAFIAANIFSAFYLYPGTTERINIGASRTGADLIVVTKDYSAVFFRSTTSMKGREDSTAIIRANAYVFRFNSGVMDWIEKVPGISGMSPQLYVSTLDVPALSPQPVDIFGIDPMTDSTIQPWLKAPLKNPLGPGEVIVGDAIQGDIASPISIGGRQYVIAGRLDPTQSSIDNTVFMGLDDAYGLASIEGIVPASAPGISRGDVTAVLVRVENGSDPAMVGAKISQPFANIATITKHFTLTPVSKDVQGLSGLLGVIALVVVIASFPLIAVISAMVTRERQREIGLLVAMGASRKTVFSIIIAESAVLALIGGIVGVGATLGIFLVLNGTGPSGGGFLTSSMSPTTIGMMAVLAIVAVVTIGVLASLWSAWQSSRMNPYDAIRYQG